ncbi:AAA family ATPase [Pedomonas mirosovicensis]|uniref:AAA family ATPase n=1 Tax=Pedomonas mirosovicensis TaxID=2908641 RepID=UPI002169ADDF|nr:MoxR family ATPase [Pedomonas mirosovicensis]MCH8684298.1 MoxR family ATPase [Pedomonas mirosovicensis]
MLNQFAQGTPNADAQAERRLAELANRMLAARQAVETVIIGQRSVVDLTLITLLAGGHALLVGVPGLAKTRLVKTLGTVLGLDTRRVQFTPDLMPTDILGSEVLETTSEGSRAFRFVHGPVFCQLLMADEINRASPRTQSALLEAMQEMQVTVAGQRYTLPQPYHVLATQNPIEQEGTYPLPEAQLDRFLFEIRIDYPGLDDERAILLATTSGLEEAPPVLFSPEELLEAQQLIRRIPVPEQVVESILRVVRATRPGPERPDIAWGAGPRAAQALLAGAKARAFLMGRTVPLLEDVEALLHPALGHRIALTYGGRARGLTTADVINGVVPLLDA